MQNNLGHKRNFILMVKGVYILFSMLVLLLNSCEFRLKPFGDDADRRHIQVNRYDRLQSQYLTTSDYSALQQMNTEYPVETSTLIEKILRIGEVNDPQINSKFLTFYQDSTLQTIISDAESQYANMDDINTQLNDVFSKLKKEIPTLPIPHIYAQIGALDQSIVVGNNMIGISLDKYLGTDYPIYKKYYTPVQMKTMTREYIVPDCICFYLLSLHPLSGIESKSQLERDLHMGKVMWVCNNMLGKRFFNNRYIKAVGKYMAHNHSLNVEQLLKLKDYTDMMTYIR